MDYMQEIREIREKLEYYSRLYYDLDAPVISDYEYDMLNNRLKELEREHPDAITPDSPTQKVGGHRSEKFSPVTHVVPLESLADIFSYEELTDFIRKTDAALGGKTVKMTFGHHGANHPVKDLDTGKTFVTSQNHGFMSDMSSLPSDVHLWFVNANDNTVEGLYDKAKHVRSVQFHPEASPGPQDATWIFDSFLEEVR